MTEVNVKAWERLAERALAAGKAAFPLWGRSTVHPGWTTTRRKLPLHLFYLVTRHTMSGIVDGDAVTLAPGEAIWIPADCEHELTLPDGAPPFSVHYFRLDLPRLSRPPRRALIARQAWELQPVLDALFDELRTDGPAGAALRRALLAQVIIGMLRGAQRGSEKNVLSPRQRQTLMTLAEQPAGDRLTARDLAEAVDLSPDYFARVFRQTFGHAPRVWIMRQRIRRAAAELAETSRPIKAIAYSLGYADLYLFSRQFRAVMGKSPRAFRREA